MESNKHIFNRIENYLKGNLSIEETAAFEKEIAVDIELAELVELHRFEQEGIEQLIEEDLRQKVKHWTTSPPNVEAKTLSLIHI